MLITNLGRAGFVPRKNYIPGAECLPLDVVRHNNTLWVCLARTFSAPSEYDPAWMLGVDGITPRRRLTENLTVYVRIDGNDTNSGLLDSPGGALATEAGILSFLSKIDVGTSKLTVQFGAGSWNLQNPYLFSGALVGGEISDGLLTIIGAGKNETLFTIPGGVKGRGSILFDSCGFTQAIQANGRERVLYLRNCKLHSGAMGLFVTNGGFAQILESIEVEGAHGTPFYVSRGGLLVAQSTNFILTNLTVSNAFFRVGDAVGAGILSLGGPLDSTSFTGSFTGGKWRAESGGMIPGYASGELNALIPGTINGISSGNTVFGGRIVAGEGTIKAQRLIGSTGVIGSRGFGLQSASRTAAGTYLITFEASLPVGTAAVVLITPTMASSPARMFRVEQTGAGDNRQFTVYLYNQSGALVDSDFFITVS